MLTGHFFTVVVLLLAIASYIAGMTGLGMLLFFVGAAIEVVLWLRAVQPPRRDPTRLLTRLNVHR
jgi:hypothetical protein